MTWRMLLTVVGLFGWMSLTAWDRTVREADAEERGQAGREIAAVALRADEKPAPDAPAKPASREELEKKFAESLSGVQLVGRFTIDGKDDPPKPEKYTINKVSKVEGKENLWLFATRIQYAQFDVAVPLTLEVAWAGDTPVITLTDFTIPGLGTFTARVLFYDGRYAGTWQHGKVGGTLFGRIEKLPADAPPPQKTD